VTWPFDVTLTTFMEIFLLVSYQIVNAGKRGAAASLE
jgi:hypothetical protein